MDSPASPQASSYSSRLHNSSYDIGAGSCRARTINWFYLCRDNPPCTSRGGVTGGMNLYEKSWLPATL
uniref:Uncharacterized protein n=1 Tax=Picea glauca TaxID=3330 RepID=A0A101M336_PICGL|nr:hypothetical protein ABT39_MTgene3285 [Picea glauca]